MEVLSIGTNISMIGQSEVVSYYVYLVVKKMIVH
jgi:hypothetical protein